MGIYGANLRRYFICRVRSGNSRPRPGSDEPKARCNAHFIVCRGDGKFGQSDSHRLAFYRMGQRKRSRQNKKAPRIPIGPDELVISPCLKEGRFLKSLLPPSWR
jgi:hypothetical protein